MNATSQENPNCCGSKNAPISAYQQADHSRRREHGKPDPGIGGIEDLGLDWGRCVLAHLVACSSCAR